MSASGKEIVTVLQAKIMYDDLSDKINSSFALTIDDIYPVGSIYMSVSSTSPSTLFGGTWQKIEGRFLLAASSSYEVESTGGSNDAIVVSHTHSASTNSTGSHSHTISGGSHSHTASSSSSGSHTHYLMYGTNRFSSNSGGGYDAGSGTRYQSSSDKTASAGSHTHTITVNTSSSHSHTVASAGSHSHTVTVSSSGQSGTGENMPAYIAVNVWKRTE